MSDESGLAVRIWRAKATIVVFDKLTWFTVFASPAAILFYYSKEVVTGWVLFFVIASAVLHPVFSKVRHEGGVFGFRSRPWGLSEWPRGEYFLHRARELTMLSLVSSGIALLAVIVLEASFPKMSASSGLYVISYVTGIWFVDRSINYSYNRSLSRSMKRIHEKLFLFGDTNKPKEYLDTWSREIIEDVLPTLSQFSSRASCRETLNGPDLGTLSDEKLWKVFVENLGQQADCDIRRLLSLSTACNIEMALVKAIRSRDYKYDLLTPENMRAERLEKQKRMFQ